MNRRTLKVAEEEAVRFLQRSKTLRDNYEVERRELPRETGAVRRASMELTRALAALRKRDPEGSTMNEYSLLAAVSEASRFINKAQQLSNAKQEAAAKHAEDSPDEPYLEGSFPAETGAVKRASMELTRALAILRKPS